MWRRAWRSTSWRRELAVGLAAAALLTVVVPQVFRAVEHRPGAVPGDAVLAWLGPAQLSGPIFALQYTALAVVLLGLRRRPRLVVRGLHAAVFMVALRMTTIGLVPLDPPPDLVLLVDPVNQLLYPGAEPLTRDLFFSGHTAVMTLLVLLARPRWMRWPLIGAAVAVAGMLLAQHVHWTVDVLAAPVFTLLAWWLSGRTTSPRSEPAPG
ncbi:phosphatase PAP2-related protein [Nakamurella leprariae]|uniref:Phosphatase PAP2 family protein n=1 Tax=Nakamurella leprariae TaxID=2803911 RepID=A0A938YDZ7_9ACTN|nr:phosphatase PAP2-related protein [Nakamurella leprariae]MBM9466008.1 phosphatase PAP2 family protein [Nakamurella leprariae]